MGAKLVSLRTFRYILQGICQLPPSSKTAPVAGHLFEFAAVANCQASIDANDIRAILKDQGIGYWKQAWSGCCDGWYKCGSYVFSFGENMLRMFHHGQWTMADNWPIVCELGYGVEDGWSHEAVDSSSRTCGRVQLVQPQIPMVPMAGTWLAGAVSAVSRQEIKLSMNDYLLIVKDMIYRCIYIYI